MTTEVFSNAQSLSSGEFTPRAALGGTSKSSEATGNSGSIMQGGINPSAAAMQILYEVMAMYSRISGINAQQQKSQILAQQQEAIGEATAMKAAGKAAMTAALTAGSMAIAGAGVSGLFTIASSSAMKNEAAKTQELEKNAAPMKEIDRLDTSMTENFCEGGETSDEVVQRAEQLKSGQYTAGQNDEEALELIKRNPEDYEAFRDRLDDRLATFEKARNTHASNGQSASMQWNTRGQAISGALSGIGTGAQGLGQQEQAKHNASAALERSAASMAGQAASAFQQAQSKAAEAQNAVQNILSAIRQTSSNV